RVGQRAISPDGEWAVAMDFNEKAALYPISGGEPRPIPGMQPGDVPIRWSIDERSLFVFRKSDSLPKIYLVDLATGRNELWKEIIPADRAGIINVWGARVALDDKSPAKKVEAQPRRREPSDLCPAAAAADRNHVGLPRPWCQD